MKNIVLIGFMGTGKSTVGRALAKRLGYRFIDTDYAIEQITGLTVEQIFRKHGVKRFRGEEVLLARKLAAQENLVIATGGGMVLDPENVKMLRQNGFLVCLAASSETICRRVRNKRTRPLLARGNLHRRVASLLEERKGAYQTADFTVNTDDKSPDEIVNIIYQTLLERGVLGEKN
ncbi:shikimate kinase [Desulforamulus hydrothermalis]|uniref:Shikimate kinase n=1 Tax=Desulforamulus hydrothermalis Lam5 = DSM 18033 TaxID=1121428 RepID=K8E0B9_9FIRM|nr:shikimate kinase [Desulforamulus hydrothermalis]CCO08865.1 Shikimate kinase [Desulforamulus hydrothermalis Lam5 = DSM 18033]SHG73535.1 shikimate kinase [Desulforamulus hydrothermalis Lam5 = DSM 18033]